MRKGKVVDDSEQFDDMGFEISREESAWQEIRLIDDGEP